MRVDKYLWCVRKFKTRGLSSEAIKKERVKINDELVKSSRTIKIKDQVQNWLMILLKILPLMNNWKKQSSLN